MTLRSYDDCEDIMKELYEGIFFRMLDDAARESMLEPFASGHLSLNVILRGLVTSDEFFIRLAEIIDLRARSYVMLNVQDFIRDSYKVVLGRLCEAEGLTFHSQNILHGVVSPSGFLFNLISSPEAQARGIGGIVSPSQTSRAEEVGDGGADMELEYAFRGQLLSAGFKLQLA